MTVFTDYDMMEAYASGISLDSGNVSLLLQDTVGVMVWRSKPQDGWRSLTRVNYLPERRV